MSHSSLLIFWKVENMVDIALVISMIVIAGLGIHGLAVYYSQQNPKG